jgi:glycosyltransferase involved in cell wall biosynthesis
VIARITVRVLHLAPPPVRPDQITAHSFIDEEIGALRAAGVDCLTFGVPRRGTPRDRASAIAFAARFRDLVSSIAWQSPSATLHAVRIEMLAAQLVADAGIDLVHSHFGWPGGFGGALAARAAGVPLVASLRGMDLLTAPEIGYGLRRDPAYAAALTQLLPTAARTLYATEYMRACGIAAGAPPERTVVIRKGVDLIRFRPPADGTRRATPTLLAVGSLSRRKNLGLALDALALVADLPWTFAIVGDGAERDALEAHAASLGLRDRVRFAGTIGRDEIGHVFADADLFVHAAVMEAAGNVILEALASGCPIVCTDAGGPTEYVRDGETGFVVPAGDVHAMAARLRMLLASPSLRCSMALSARRSAEQEFAYERMIGDVIQLYGCVALAQIS